MSADSFFKIPSYDSSSDENKVQQHSSSEEACKEYMDLDLIPDRSSNTEEEEEDTEEEQEEDDDELEDDDVDYRWQQVENTRKPVDMKPDGHGYGSNFVPAGMGAGVTLDPMDISSWA